MWLLIAFVLVSGQVETLGKVGTQEACIKAMDQLSTIPGVVYKCLEVRE